MRQSQLFTKTTKNIPKDEVSKNAQLLIKAGYIHKEMAGVYSFLPLGLKVLNKIIDIIRDEMNKIGCQEISMNTLQRKELWELTDRWDDEKVDVWFKSTFKNGSEVGFGWTHEEQITGIMNNFINSYKDLPIYAYQFQTKLRNETRAKSGILRTREFIMKDLYSFSKNKDAHNEFYEKAKQAYVNVFKRLGIGDVTYFTFASGGAFSKFSHEFQTVCDAGEDIIYISKEKNIAINQEVLNDEVLNNLGIKKEELVEEKACEVGNIFTLGERFSEPQKLQYTDEEGKLRNVFMGSYGIGPARTMGVIAELMSDENGLVWPKAVTPYQIHLVSLGVDEEIIKESEKIYNELLKLGIEVLYDDRLESVGVKLNDSDLLGIPLRIVIGSKGLEKNSYEVKFRNQKTVEFISKDKALEFIKRNV